jgi:hypothetical protein
VDAALESAIRNLISLYPKAYLEKYGEGEH